MRGYPAIPMLTYLDVFHPDEVVKGKPPPPLVEVTQPESV